jgi:hypothetical protein
VQALSKHKRCFGSRLLAVLQLDVGLAPPWVIWVAIGRARKPRLEFPRVLLTQRYIYTIDDDCFVAQDPSGRDINVLETHIRNITTPSTPFFFNTLYDPFREGADFVRGMSNGRQRKPWFAVRKLACLFVFAVMGIVTSNLTTHPRFWRAYGCGDRHAVATSCCGLQATRSACARGSPLQSVTGCG